MCCLGELALKMVKGLYQPTKIVFCGAPRVIHIEYVPKRRIINGECGTNLFGPTTAFAEEESVYTCLVTKGKSNELG